jgi:hypothetical protein
MKILESGLAAAVHGQAFDVVVVGAGGAGMACALFSALRGARVLLVEHTGLVGGTTALSAGSAWIPGTRHAAQVNPADTLSDSARYLDLAVADAAPAALREAFLANGERTVALLEADTDVQFRPYARHPDYISDLAGSTLNGRALEPLPFDARQLGDLFRLLREPIPEFTVLGGMMVDRTDINHLLGMTRSWASLRHSAALLLRHLRDRLSHPRGTRLVMGNALAGRLLHSLAQRSEVTLAMNTALADFTTDTKGHIQVTLAQGSERCSVTVNGGLVLASGGFSRHPALRAQWLPGADPAWSPLSPGTTGTAIELALQRGAHFNTGARTASYWAPVSRRTRADGSTAVFPHFVMDRAKPGTMVVNQAGRRFLNESTSYHLFGLAMQAAHRESPAIPAWLLADARALRQYGLGMVRPGGRGLAAFLADGYLVEAASVRELAVKLDMHPDQLEHSVARFNGFAETGIDTDFQRGVTAYQHNIGDATWPGKNPNLGALTEAPFYALRLYPGDIGAAMGLATDAGARMQDSNQIPMPGLYAVGNDMQSIMGGAYPGPGITIGPGLVFAMLAAQDACARAGVRASGAPDR